MSTYIYDDLSYNTQHLNVHQLLIMKLLETEIQVHSLLTITTEILAVVEIQSLTNDNSRLRRQNNLAISVSRSSSRSIHKGEPHVPSYNEPPIHTAAILQIVFSYKNSAFAMPSRRASVATTDTFAGLQMLRSCLDG